LGSIATEKEKGSPAPAEVPILYEDQSGEKTDNLGEFVQMLLDVINTAVNKGSNLGRSKMQTGSPGCY
jgi:hypothetical protein